MQKSILLLSCLLFVFIGIFAAFSQDIVVAAGEIFLLEDFEPIESKSFIDCSQGTWQGDILGPVSGCQGWLVPETRALKETAVLRLVYRFRPATADTCGYFFKFEKIDLTSFIDLNLYVKGDRWDGFPDSFEVQLRQGERSVSRKIDGITAFWQKVTIPLDSFKQGLDGCRKIDSLRIVFNTSSPDSKQGIIYIDDISFSGSAPRLQLLVNDYIDRGNSYCDQGKYEAGLEEYKKAIKLDSDNIYARTNLGLAYLKQQKYCEAAEELEEVLQINPSYAFAHLSLAIIYEDYFFKTEKAIEHYNEFLQLDRTLDLEMREKLIQWVEGIRQAE